MRKHPPRLPSLLSDLLLLLPRRIRAHYARKLGPPQRPLASWSLNRKKAHRKRRLR